MALLKENINNLIVDDLDKRNQNWTEIDNTFELKADKSTTYTKTEVDTSLDLKADKTYVDGQDSALTAQLAETDQEIMSFKEDYANLVTEVNKKADKISGELIEPTYLNGWLRRNEAPFYFYKDGLGRVSFEGTVMGGPPMSVIFILPVGYRPRSDLYVPIYSTDRVTQLRIFRNGDVVFQGNVATTWTTLGNISFSAQEV